MAHRELPAHPSLEFLRKLAKDRLREMRGTERDGRLSDAQLAVAREHGFSSWRALKAEVDRRRGSSALLDAGSDVHGRGDAHGLDVIGWAAGFAERRPDVIRALLAQGARHNVFSAVAAGDHEALRRLVVEDPAALGRRLPPAELDWAEVTLGKARLMFASSGDDWRRATRGLALWFYTSRIDDVYADLKRRQLDRSRAVLAGGEPETPEIRFRADLYTTHYGIREFSVEDPHGVDLTFAQPAE